MQKAEIISYCDNLKSQNNEHFRFDTRGGTAFIGTAHRTDTSCSDAACGRILGIMSESFMRRPSLCDEAMETITDFANQSVYALQEPDRRFMAHAAVLFLHKGKARGVISGNGRIYCLSDGKLVFSSEPKEHLLIGKRPSYKDTFTAAFPLRGKTALILCSGTGNADINKEELEKSFDGVSGADEWAERLNKLYEGQQLSVTAAIMPERKFPLPALFRK